MRISDWSSDVCSSDLPAPWHYIVETDIAPQAEQDFNDWYGNEHLPGLAAVPGTVSARRYLARPAQPKYYASYDLETLETFGSASWLVELGRATSELQSLMRTSYAVSCLKKNNLIPHTHTVGRLLSTDETNNTTLLTTSL